MSDRRYRIAGPIVVAVALLTIGLCCSVFLFAGGLK